MSKFFLKTLAVLNLGEGVIHIVTASVSFWGMYSLGMWDWRVATSPTADFALGIVSLVTGMALGKWQAHRETSHKSIKDQALCSFAATTPAT